MTASNNTSPISLYAKDFAKSYAKKEGYNFKNTRILQNHVMEEIMGGTGSGRWKKHKCKKLIEETLKVNIRIWIAQGKITAGNEFEWLWYDETGAAFAKIGVRVSSNQKSLEIFYELGNESIINYVHLGYTEHGFGGHRIWFICPLCNRRVVDLYLVKSYFCCRHCSKLGYLSERRKYNEYED